VIVKIRDNDPNLAILELATLALGDLCDSLVFVGGCAAGLLFTVAQAQAIRATQDVDVVVQVATTREYHAMGKELINRGFKNDQSSDAPICRWLHGDLKLDLMPSEGAILGFNNRWYPLAIQTAEHVDLPSGRVIRLIFPPVFIATKLEAFRDRGNGDYLASHDLEDILSVVDGRIELIAEARGSGDDLRSYLSTEIRALLGTSDFLDALPGHLPGDNASQQRAPELLRRLRQLSEMV
jgi:predicted nucleotidyltransferase